MTRKVKGKGVLSFTYVVREVEKYKKPKDPTSRLFRFGLVVDDKRPLP